MDFRAVIFGFGSTIIGYLVWRSSAHASSLIRGTATGRIATAAKGYAEVKGTASAPATDSLRDPITHQSCVWFSVVTEEFSILDKFRWKVVKRARSSRPFVIDDGTGRCLVSPEEADIDERQENTIVKDRWDLRHKVWWIREGDPIYAIGFLQRTSDLTVQTILREPGRAAATDEQVLTRRATALLRSWKQDPARLIRRFDADGDGKIDAQEWEKARLSAHREAAGSRGADQQSGPSVSPADPDAGNDITHRMVKPPDGRPFLLTTHGEDSLVSRNRKSAFWGLVFFVIGVITLVALLRECVGGT